MHCQVPGIDYSLSKLAIHAALESATAIALSHTGILYIAETDEKKINRVRQVWDGTVYIWLFWSFWNEWVNLKLICWPADQTEQLARRGVGGFTDTLRVFLLSGYCNQQFAIALFWHNK